MRFLILSESGDGVGLALRLKLEGHDVQMWPRTSDRAGRGLIDFADGYQFGQTVVVDCTGFGPLLDKFRDAGVPTFGGSSFHDKLESDRKFAEEVMLRAEISVPASTRARSWEEAAAASEEMSERSFSGKVVLKPEGALSGSLPSYVAADPEDAASALEQWKKKHMSGDVELTVQEFVEGVPISTEGWFDGEDWIDGSFNHTLERKHFLDGDVGPSGGCTGNVVWAVPASDPIVRETLTKLTPTLREHRYIGPLDVNCVVNEGDCYAIEFTPRFGYDAFPTLLHGLAEVPLGSFLDDCARTPGRASLALRDGFAAGVRLSVPPWPSEDFHADSGIAIRGLGERDLEWFYPYEVCDEGGGSLATAGGAGIVGVMNGRGGVIGEAFARAYERVERMKVPSLQYRTDLARTFLDDWMEFERIIAGEREHGGWIGVDLDGTLAWHRKGQESIGRPIAEMTARINRWVASGREVRIVTARAGIKEGRWARTVEIYDWLERNLGRALEVTSEKDPWMIALYDDRAVEVEKNEGELVR